MKSLLVCCLLPALTAASPASPPQFSSRRVVGTGFKQLGGMAVADFNGDGKPDIAATDQTVKRIFIYLNDGNGYFGAPKSMDINMSSDGPEAVVAGDFNEDGKQDLILSASNNKIGDPVLLGNGDGTFTQQPDLPTDGSWTGGYFSKGVLVDLNGDQHLDLILGGNSAITFYLGDGRGNFQALPTPYPGNANIFTGIVTGDFNKDGKVDFSLANPYATYTSVFLGNGDGTFPSPIYLSTKVGTRSVDTADFDGDGNLDLLLGFNRVGVVCPGKGDGSFNTSEPYYLATSGTAINPNGYAALAAAADGDKKIDAVVADDQSETINVFINDGTGKFPQATPDFSAAIDGGLYEMATADLNADGLPDIVVTSNATKNISIFLSISPKTAVTAMLTPSANPQLVGSSVTFTGKIDGATNNAPTGTVTLHDGTKTLGQQTLDGNAQASFSLSSLSAGQHSLTISYSGDNNYRAATSSVLTQSIVDFQVALPTSSQTVAAGGTATYSLNVTPAGGLTGSISITCSQLPSLASCDPVTVPVTGQPATATLAVHTTAPITSRHHSTIHTAGFGFLSIAFTALLSLRRRRPVQLFVAAVALVLIGSSIACSSGSTSSTSNPPVTTTPGTPQGMTQFTITSSVTLGGQTLTRTSTATLVVQ